MTTIQQVDTDAAPVFVATSPQDAEAAETIRAHHAELAGRLQTLVGAVFSARNDAEATYSRDELAAYCRTDLLPHAVAEEATLYPLAGSAPRASLLVEAMVNEHRVLEALVDRIERSPRHIETVAAGYALQVLFESHLAAENDLLLPLIAGDPSMSLANSLHEMDRAFTAARGDATHGHGHAVTEAAAGDEHGHGGHSCGCGEAESGELVLDVRAVPHKIRHATVFGAYDAVPVGGTLVLVAPHDPLPLLHQLSQRDPRVQVDYEERGPDAWRLRLTRGS